MNRSDLPGVYKIGQSGSPIDRLTRMQEAHLFDMQVVKTYPDMGCYEFDVHLALKQYRVRPDREWFEAPLKQIYETIEKFTNQDPLE